MFYNVSLHTVCISFTPSHPSSIFLELLRMVPAILLFFKSLFHVFFYFYFFNLRLCLWFDLHRHLFLLVLFLLCGCDFNQEMEMQKSTCCHSKYVRFHPQIYRSPRPSPCSSRVCVCLFVCVCMAVLREMFCVVN